jgi:NADH:ubiquinone oxidoreductase subunit 3 (subunit A)
MKLNLLFIIMDLLTLLAYPIVFAHGKLGQFSKSKESITLQMNSIIDRS